jgi:hypothetical protein
MSKQKPSLQDILKKRQQDWQNTFNLAVYHLAAGQTAVANRLYREGINAPPHSIRDAINDLEDCLTVQPGHERATAMRGYLRRIVDEQKVEDNRKSEG